MPDARTTPAHLALAHCHKGGPDPGLLTSPQAAAGLALPLTIPCPHPGRLLYVPKRAFNPVYLPHLMACQPLQIFFGGAGSGKSVFLATRVVLDALQGRNSLVVRQVARSLRASAFNELQKAIGRLGLKDAFSVNRTEMRLSCLWTGAEILLTGLDDVEKVKSITPAKGVLTDIWVEEATECRYEDIKQLQKRLRGPSAHAKRLSLSFNPVSAEHWLFKRYFTGWEEGQRLKQTDKLLILKTDHRDNLFLTADDRQALESEEDSYFFDVYTRGDWGRAREGIFNRWQVMARDEAEAAFGRLKAIRCGLDFGFAKDPSATIVCGLDPHNRVIVVRHARYDRGLTLDRLAERIRPLVGAKALLCDQAEPRSIAELRRHGLCAAAAPKGPDSLLFGIHWLCGHRLLLHPDCVELATELSQYRWKTGADGATLPIPTGPDHLIDALRYALSLDMKGAAKATL